MSRPRQTAELLKEINKERTVVVVEHDMTFVRELGVKVTCLHEGSVLAEGTIDRGLDQRSRGRSCIWGGDEDECSTSKAIDLHYGAAQALRAVSMTAEVGKVTCVLGRNGVGKTSLLDALAGQHPVSRGDIVFEGEKINALQAVSAGAARHRLCAAGPRDLSAADGGGESRDRLCAAQARRPQRAG